MVKIICRIKPPKEDNIEIVSDKKILLFKKDRNLLDKSILKPYQFELDRFYDYDVETLKIYNEEIKPILINEFGVFIYGHTGSGKTYTMFGNEESKGIFDLISEEFDNEYEIEALDLRYNGIFDLFSENKIVLYSNENNEDICNNTFKQKINKSNYKFIKDKIFTSRTRGKSKHNNLSSRSHLVIYIYKNNKKYTIVDLAGNERKPKLFDKVNEQETSYINSSLLALKECFRSFGKSYMPYRRSDLTRLLKKVILKDNLLICTVHSGYPYFYDSVDTLNYIYSLLNKVKTKPDFFERKVMPISPKKVPKIKNNFLQKDKVSRDKLLDEFREKKSMSPRNFFPSKDDMLKSEESISDKFSDIFNDDLNLIQDLEDDFNFKIGYEYDDIADSKLSNESISSLDDKKEIITEENFEDYEDDFEEEFNYDNIDSNNAKLIVKNNLNSKYKRKVLGLINHFIYKKVISNYKQLLNKEIDSDELDTIIFSTLSILDFSTKELLKIN